MAMLNTTLATKGQPSERDSFAVFIASPFQSGSQVFTEQKDDSIVVAAIRDFTGESSLLGTIDADMTNAGFRSPHDYGDFLTNCISAIWEASKIAMAKAENHEGDIRDISFRLYLPYRFAVYAMNRESMLRYAETGKIGGREMSDEEHTAWKETVDFLYSDVVQYEVNSECKYDGKLAALAVNSLKDVLGIERETAETKPGRRSRRAVTAE